MNERNSSKCLEIFREIRFLVNYIIIVTKLCPVLLFFSFVFKSCCTEIFCYSAEDLGSIELLNFSSIELDSTYLVYYTQGSDFQITEDSVLLEIVELAETNIFDGHYNRRISIDFDYKLYLKYTISRFNTIQAECNECFLKKDYYQKLENYAVNGKVKNLSRLQIDKLSD
jgi:hypothetical protein